MDSLMPQQSLVFNKVTGYLFTGSINF